MKKTAFLALLLFVVGMHAHAAAIIRNAATAAANQWVCFRKTINISEGDLSQAELRIAADSKYWLWVNGELEVFEGQLKRGPNATDTYIDALQPKHLHAGDNTIAVLVWYFGKEGFSHRNSPCPGLYFDLIVGDRHYESDETWRTSLHTAYYTPSGETPNARLAESNVGFNARRDMEGWQQPAYDDSSWENALTVDAAESGWGSFVERPIPQWKDYGVRSYVSQETSGNTITCTLPYNAQVTPILTVRASAGKTIGIQTDDYKPTNENSVRAEYITKEGEQTYESLGWMNGHEVIYTIPEGVEVLSLGYRETGYDCEFAGSFSCNDADLNRLWQMSQRTLYITMRDNFMDCPDRERAQWIGDFAIELEEIFYSLSANANLLSAKCLHEFAAWQHEDGTLHAPVPEGNYDVELPQQCLAAMGWGAWNYYLGTGDRKTIEDVFPAWKKYMHVWQMDENGLVVYRQGGWDWGDWGSNQDMQALCQFWYAVALDYYAQQAELVGDTTEAEWARTLNESLKEAIRQKLWTGSAYRHPDYTGATDDRTQAMAILSGVATEDQYAAIYSILKNTQYASPYMERFVLEALCQMGYVDDAVARMRSRYQPMIDSSYSTLWELFTLSGGTYNHAWSGAPLLIMSQYVAGVQPLDPGFKKFRVRPHLGNLQQALTVVPSVSGDIVVSVKQEAGLLMDVTVPEGTTALISLPADYAYITIDGVTATFESDTTGGFVEKEVGAGHYVVKALGMDTTSPLITSPAQLSSSGHHENFVTDYLIDNDTTTYFHASVLGFYEPDWSTYESYIQVELNKPVSAFFLTTDRRYESGSNDIDNNCVPPRELEVRASNDGETWVSITTLSNLPATQDTWPYTSPLIQLGDNYKYVRFYCHGVYGYNFSYWCLSELQMYPQVDENTYYLNRAIAEAEALLPLAYDKEALIYEADDEDDSHNQFSSNARWTYLDAASGGQGSYAALIDRNDQTYFHSAYANAPKTHSYLQVDLKRTDISAFTLEMLRRGDGNWNDAWNQMPNNIDIYATNETSAVTAATTDEAWHFVTTLNSGFPAYTSHKYYTSPLVEMDAPYQHLRFVVKGTCYGGNNDAGFPFFNMSEFQLYSDKPAPTSEYFTVPGMQQAYDALSQLVEETKTKMEQGTAEMADTAAIYAAISTMQALYVDRESIENSLEEQLNEALTSYRSAFTFDPLITSATQITPTGTASGTKANLIDGNAATTYSLSGSVALNQSKTYLTFNLGRTDIERVIVSFQGCAGSEKHTPSALDVYVSSNNQNYKRVAALTKGFPGTQDNAVYASPVIEMGSQNKYLRIIPTGVAGEANPMAFALAEVQVMNGDANTETSLYYKYNDLQQAVEALAEQMAATQQKIDTRTAIDLADEALLQQRMDEVAAQLKKAQEEESTAIVATTITTASTLYNIAGQRLTHAPAHGVYISNGKTIFVK